MPSLQDQLKNSGLIDKKKAKQIQKEKHKQHKQAVKSGQALESESRRAAEQALAAKAERDRELNRQREAQAQEKAIAAQIRQLITTNKVNKDQAGRGEQTYNFADGKTVKTLYLDNATHGQLSRGQLAVAKLDDGYELVPTAVAEKIAERKPDTIVVNNRGAEQMDDDDPYKDYVIPDDLMW